MQYYSLLILALASVASATLMDDIKMSVAGLTGLRGGAKSGFSVEDCGSAYMAIHNHGLSIGPDPIDLTKEITVSGTSEISEVLPQDGIDVDITVIHNGRRVPCSTISTWPYQVGSCRYDDVCTSLFPGRGDICPPQNGGDFTLPPTTFIPDTTEWPEDLMQSGTYEITQIISREVAVITGQPMQLGCLRVQVELA